jgi:hypothetical protein
MITALSLGNVFVEMCGVMRSFITCSLVQYIMIKSRRIRWTGHVGRMGKKRNVYRISVGRPEGRRLLGRPTNRWNDIKMDHIEIGLN